MIKNNFTVDITSFKILTGKVELGRIVELSSSETNTLTPHIDGHPHTIYAVASGVPLTEHAGVFQSGSAQIAVEWVRHETRPGPKEPECNARRYLFGITNDNRCVGIDVTVPWASGSSGQVADHWSTLNEVVLRHFPPASEK